MNSKAYSWKNKIDPAVDKPILNNPFVEPKEDRIYNKVQPKKMSGRRPAEAVAIKWGYVDPGNWVRTGTEAIRHRRFCL